jgi:chromosome segregation ATPase
MSDSLIVGISGVILGLGSLIVAFLKKPHETQSLDAQTIKTYAEAAKINADRAENTAKMMDARNADLMMRVTELENERETLRAEREALGDRVKALEDENKKLHEERLSLSERVKALEEENEVLRQQLLELKVEPAKTRKRKDSST